MSNAEPTPSWEEMEQWLREGRYDEVEQAVLQGYLSLEGAIELAGLFRQCLHAAVAAGLVETNRAQAEALFHRALRWAQCAYPAPHTAMEADDYNQGRQRDRAELVQVLGYEPPDA